MWLHIGLSLLFPYFGSTFSVFVADLPSGSIPVVSESVALPTGPAQLQSEPWMALPWYRLYGQWEFGEPPAVGITSLIHPWCWWNSGWPQRPRFRNRKGSDFSEGNWCSIAKGIADGYWMAKMNNYPLWFISVSPVLRTGQALSKQLLNYIGPWNTSFQITFCRKEWNALQVGLNGTNIWY